MDSYATHLESAGADFQIVACEGYHWIYRNGQVEGISDRQGITLAMSYKDGDAWPTVDQTFGAT